MFNETIMIIFEDFALQKPFICGNKDLPWMTKQIEKKFKEKNKSFRSILGGPLVHYGYK